MNKDEASDVLPPIEEPSTQKLGLTAQESDPPRWPQPRSAPANAPNVLIILTDDVGFGACSTFGGLIPTPTLDALASGGLRYNRFHTSAMCSPTRAALLTGRNPHAVAMGNISHFATGYDGYTSAMPKSAGMLAETLRQNGYSTAAMGKWHLTPEWEASSQGPFDRWPTGQGFEYFYGFLGADTDQFSPALVENTTAITPPAGDPDYILDRDLVDRAIRWTREQHALTPGKPFFMYYAPGTAHAPYQAPRDWLERFRGAFDQGWDRVREEVFARQKAQGVVPADAELTPRPDFLPAWDSLPAEHQRLFARYMEAFAAMLAFFDHQIGRLFEHLRASGQLENTLIFFIQGDNGSDAAAGLTGAFFEQAQLNKMDEDLAYALAHIDDIGGPRSYSKFPAGWAWAMNTPFQYYKQVASHLGGVRNGLVVHWPAGIQNAGGLRSHFAHVVDVVPTILQATGIRTPSVLNGVEQKPLDGSSFADSFRRDSPTDASHSQVFEMYQNMAIYEDGWWAGTRPANVPWLAHFASSTDPRTRTWELYDLRGDFSQAHDLAQQHPERLDAMRQRFLEEAARCNILPIHGNNEGAEGCPTPLASRSRFVFHAGMTRIPESFAPGIFGRSYTIQADVEIPEGGASGVLITHGGFGGGYAFYLHHGAPVFHYNGTSGRQYPIRAAEPLAAGPHRLEARFVSDGPQLGSGGTLTISDNGKELVSGRIEYTHRRWMWEGLDIGEDSLTPVNDDYTIAGSRFTGTLHRVVVELE
ncbi:arylsulfatase [Alcaligenaceae bacterium]|nr:arylsulfatase [Alcaligenaceae bacterium]